MPEKYDKIILNKMLGSLIYRQVFRDNQEKTI